MLNRWRLAVNVAIIEQEIADAVSRFHREQQGHAPAEVHAFVMEDMVVVRCAKVFTPTEQDLAQSDEGKKAIQSARREQRALTRREIEADVSAVVEKRILRSFYDLDVRTADAIEVYILDSAL